MVGSSWNFSSDRKIHLIYLILELYTDLIFNISNIAFFSPVDCVWQFYVARSQKIKFTHLSLVIQESFQELRVFILCLYIKYNVV